MNAIAFMTPGPTDWLLVLVIVLVLFGTQKLPELARGLGPGFNEFRKAREDCNRSLRGVERPANPGERRQPSRNGMPPPSLRSRAAVTRECQRFASGLTG
jgi:TatA/E family protein of Tat protein translocase